MGPGPTAGARPEPDGPLVALLFSIPILGFLVSQRNDAEKFLDEVGLNCLAAGCYHIRLRRSHPEAGSFLNHDANFFEGGQQSLMVECSFVIFANQLAIQL